MTAPNPYDLLEPDEQALARRLHEAMITAVRDDIHNPNGIDYDALETAVGDDWDLVAISALGMISQAFQTVAKATGTSPDAALDSWRHQIETMKP